jgi:cupin fold WbuC family metalloprotein
MIIIDQRFVSTVTDEAKRSARKRKNHNFHRDYSDPVNRLLNALEPGTYVRPHKHESPDKWEAFIILCGKALVLRFDHEGTVMEHAVLDGAHGIYGAEFPSGEWPMIVSLVSGTVVYEVKPGPYAPTDDKNFAPWAPAEGSPDAVPYLASLLARLGFALPASRP